MTPKQEETPSPPQQQPQPSLSFPTVSNNVVPPPPPSQFLHSTELPPQQLQIQPVNHTEQPIPVYSVPTQPYPGEETSFGVPDYEEITQLETDENELDWMTMSMEFSDIPPEQCEVTLSQQEPTHMDVDQSSTQPQTISTDTRYNGIPIPLPLPTLAQPMATPFEQQPPQSIDAVTVPPVVNVLTGAPIPVDASTPMDCCISSQAQPGDFANVPQATPFKPCAISTCCLTEQQILDPHMFWSVFQAYMSRKINSFVRETSYVETQEQLSPTHAAIFCIGHAMAIQNEQHIRHSLPFESEQTDKRTTNLNFGRGGSDPSWVSIAERCIASCYYQELLVASCTKKAISTEEAAAFLGRPPPSPQELSICKRQGCKKIQCMIVGYDQCSVLHQLGQSCVCNISPYCETCQARISADKTADMYMQGAPIPCCVMCDTCKKPYCIYSLRVFGKTVKPKKTYIPKSAKVVTDLSTDDPHPRKRKKRAAPAPASTPTPGQLPSQSPKPKPGSGRGRKRQQPQQQQILSPQQPVASTPSYPPEMFGSPYEPIPILVAGFNNQNVMAYPQFDSKFL
jgi:hypothetical protein